MRPCFNNKKILEDGYMKKIIIILALSIALASCASIKDKMPKFEKKVCDGSKKTIADIYCKKEQ